MSAIRYAIRVEGAEILEAVELLVLHRIPWVGRGQWGGPLAYYGARNGRLVYLVISGSGRGRSWGGNDSWDAPWMTLQAFRENVLTPNEF